MRALRAVAATASAVAALVACGSSQRPAATATAFAPVRSGTLEVAGAWVGGLADGVRPVYLTLVEHGGEGDHVVAVVSRDARSAAWVNPRHVHTLDEIAAGTACSGDPRLVYAGARALLTSGDVAVRPHSTTTLAPGGAHLQLIDPRPLRVGDTAEVQVVFASGTAFDLHVPVRA